ncbi:MAG: DUF488 domain-containing protein [Pseudomonadota bacterium]
MSPEPPVLYTIGYERIAPEQLLATLLAAGVTRLIDVREVPISRRKGFAKTALASALAARGIDYVHLRGLGTPKPGREAAKAGDRAGFLEIFARHMESPEAQSDLARVEAYARDGGACLFCLEREPERCHRSQVAAALTARLALSVEHLVVALP